MAACHRIHGLDTVHQKIHYNLLQLDAVAIDRRKRRPEIELQSYSMSVDLPEDHRDDVIDGLIYIKPHAFGRALLGQRADARNHFARVSGTADHLFDRDSCLVNSRYLAVKPSEACTAIRDHAGKRLAHFMSD